MKAPTDRSRSDCVHEQVAKRIANVRFTNQKKKVKQQHVYATFGYLQEILEAEGCKTVMLPGVTSFCAAAARLGQSLTGGMEQPLTIAPGRCAAEVLAAPGAKVLMKSGRQLPETLAALADAGLLSRSAMVCNCGLPNEEVWPDLTDYDPARSAGYFATILVKEG